MQSLLETEMTEIMLKRMLCACLAVCLTLGATLVLSIPAAAASKNLFKNGNMNRNLTGWSTWTNDPSAASFTFVRDADAEGKGCLKITNKAQAAASVYQFAGMEKGKTYIMTADVKCENVSTEGAGFILGVTMYDAAGNNIGELASSSRFGTSDGWSTVSFVFTVSNENCASVNGGPRLWFSTGTVYVDNLSVCEIVREPAISETYELTVSETPNRFPVNALGCEWDPKLLLPCNKEQGVTDEDLDVIKESMDKLGLQAVRMMIMPEWFEPANDNDDPSVAAEAGFSWESDEIKNTLAYLKVCHELGIRVTLTWWGAAAGSWLAFPNCNDWISAPNSAEEISENMAYFIRYVRDELGYDCIYNVILMNEPSYAFHVEGGAVDFEYYVRCYELIRARLDAEGLEDIRLVGSDDAQSLGWFCNSYDRLRNICDAFDSHNYAWTYDTPYLDQLVTEFVSSRTQYGQEKPFFMGEFGDGTTQGAYYATSVETYGRGLYLAANAVNTLSAGAAGLSYWSLHDVYYYINDQGGDNGGLMETGLIGYKTDGAWKYRPSYFAWGLICNYIPYGSMIYKVSGENGSIIDCLAAKTPEGDWTLVAVNRSDAEQTVKVSSTLMDVPMNVYTYAEDSLPDSTKNDMIAASGIAVPESGVYTITLPPYCFKVLSNIEEVDLPETETAGQGSESETLTPSAPADTSTPVDTDADTKPSAGCASVTLAPLGVTVSAGALAALIARKRRRRK